MPKHRKATPEAARMLSCYEWPMLDFAFDQIQNHPQTELKFSYHSCPN